jgi:hypothetical protein
LGTPSQRFQLWKPSGVVDIGTEELDGRSREEIWRSLQRRSPDLREFGEYRLYVKQDEVNWSNLLVIDLTIVPTVIPVVERGTEFPEFLLGCTGTSDWAKGGFGTRKWHAANSRRPSSLPSADMA